MPSLKRKVPPPPREPGTHTNTEVKEALHARALRRTILITAVVFLLLACLAVVSNSAREAVGDTGKPKLVLIVVKGLSPGAVSHAMSSNKAPFTRLLSSIGGNYSVIDAAYPSSGNKLVNLLTGSADAKQTLSGSQSILRRLHDEKKKVVVAAPASYWSLGPAGTATCPQVGLLDTECSGSACPDEKEAAYCNAARKYITCDDRAQLYQNEIPTAFEKTISSSADMLYFQVSSIAEAASSDVEAAAQERSEVNLLDAAVGRIALALSKRTANTAENWLMIVTSDGSNTEARAPLLVVAYTKGEIVRLNAIAADARVTDVANTVKMWFQLRGVDQNRLLGICTNGAEVKNCNKTA
ncbi:hypothetical protein N2W54_007033 [Lotmaria passim]